MGTATLTAMDMDMKRNSLPTIAAAGITVFGLISVADAQIAGMGAAPITMPDRALGNEPATGRAWNIVPRISLTETLSNNINLASSGQQTGLITQVMPGIRIDGRTARLKVYFDYALSGNFYTNGSQNSNTNSYLTTFGTFEAVDNWLFVDFRGMVSQQLINPFGTQSPSNAYNNGNTAQTGSYGVSPYIRGQFAGASEYFLRYNYTYTNSGAGGFSDVTLSQWLGQLRGNTRFQNLKWTIDGSQQSSDYSRGRSYDDQRLRAMLTYHLFPEFNVSGSGGTESNNYQSLNMEGHTTYGYGFDWAPTDRTTVSAFQEERFFGNGHNVLFSHRFPLSTIRYTDVRDVSFLPGQYTTSGLGTFYDMYYEQFTSLIPDPGARSNYVRNMLSQAGISPNAQATSDYLANRPRVQRLQQLSLILYGSRNSITFAASRSNNEALTAVPGAAGNAIGNASRIEQQGYLVFFSHRLTPLTALNLSGNRQTTESGQFVVAKTTMTTYQAGIATRFGPKTVGSLNLRHSQFDSPVSPYDETALVGTIALFF